MTAICSKCRSELSITGNWGGQEVVCPKCKWRVVSSSTCNIDEFSVAAHRNELVVILERITPVV